MTPEAGFCIMLLGNGQLGLRCWETKQQTPILFGWPEWLEENMMHKDHGEDRDSRLKFAGILDTVLIGSRSDRAECLAALSHMPESEHEKYLAERHDRMRSSLSDIGAGAKRLAAKLREVAERQSA